MNKIKSIFLKIFNWGKKNKILSIFLCILVLGYAVKGCIWIYNDIAYGRFVKVGEKHIDDTQYSSLYETDYGTIKFFVPSNSYINKKTPVKKIIIRVNSPTISFPSEEIYIINKAFVLSKEVKDGFLYDLDEKNKKLKFIRSGDKLNKYSPNIQPIVKFFSNNENKLININNGKTNKTIDLKDVGSAREMISLDNQNLLFFFNDAKGWFSFNYAYKYFLKENKLYKIDTSEIPYLNGLHNKLVYLGNNKFLFLQNKQLYGQLVNIILYTLVHDKFIKQELKLPTNNPLFGFSTDNPLVLNNNQILFVGGAQGYLDISWITKKCYLYDIKKNKIIKINNFPFRLKKVRILKTKSGEFYIPVVHNENDHTKHFIYKYKKGRFIK